MPATFHDSRQGIGTLSFGTFADAAVQCSEVKITPDAAEETGTATLANPTPAPDYKRTQKISGKFVQDFESSSGIVEYLWAHDGTEVAFTWEPKTGGVSYSGMVQLRAVEIGGAIAEQLSTEFEFPIVGELVRTYPAGTTRAAK